MPRNIFILKGTQSRSQVPLERNDWNFTDDLIVSFSIKIMRQHIQQIRHSWKSSSWDLNDFLPHPPYSPDLAPVDFAVFPKLKSALLGIKFHDFGELKRAILNAVRSFDTDLCQSVYDRRPLGWCLL